MADERGKVAEGYVEITADTSKLKAGLGEAKAETQAFVKETEVASEKVEETTAKTAGWFGRVGAGIKDSTRETRVFLSALTSSVGIVTRLLGLFGLLAGALAAIGAGAKALFDTFVLQRRELERIEALLVKQRELIERPAESKEGAFGFRAQREELDRLLAEIDRVQSRITRESSIVGRLFGDRNLREQSKNYLRFLESQADELRRVLSEANKKVAADRERADAESVAKSLEDKIAKERAVNEQLQIESLEGADRVNAEWIRKVRETLAQAKEAESEALRSVFYERIVLLTRARDAEFAAIHERARLEAEEARKRAEEEDKRRREQEAEDARRIAERERAEYEAFERQQQRMAEAAERSAQSFARAMEQAFRSVDMANTIRQGTGPLLAELRDVALQLKINSMTGGRS